VIRIQDGVVLKDFNLGSSSRGLSSIIAGDYRVDGSNPYLSVSDVAFAGDLNGNIWRFNFEGSTPASWTAEKFFTAGTNQAITVQPRIARTAYEDITGVRRKFVVTFGTGKYIENADRSTVDTQAYYGVYDQGPAATGYPITVAQLQQQTLTTVGSVRRLTTTQIPAAKKGWFFNFIATGERNISQAVVRNVSGTLIFTTLAPLSTNPCQPAAESFLMFADATTGGVPGTGAAGRDTNNDGIADTTDVGQISPSFDSNRDGTVNGSDDALAVGLKLNGYIAGVTPISSVGGGSAEILIPDDGNGGGASSIGIANYEWRRRSWRELINQ
jgi:type IV pilus assembly protein PilY1